MQGKVLLYSYAMFADTCDVMWQSVRDNLAIAALTFSFASLCVVICTLVVVLSKRRQSTKKGKEKVTWDSYGAKKSSL
jgi:hypothetical protein